jgi:hypothetical protein
VVGHTGLSKAESGQHRGNQEKTLFHREIPFIREGENMLTTTRQFEVPVINSYPNVEGG